MKTLLIENSEVTIKETCGESYTPVFFHGGGIQCGDLIVNNSTLNVDVDSEDIGECIGINVTNNATVTDSTVKCSANTSGRVFGLAVSGNLSVKGSTIIADCSSADEQAFGIMYKKADFDLNQAGNKIDATVEDGFAMGANIGRGTEFKGFDKDYKVTSTTFGKNTVFETPLNAVLNRASMQQSVAGNYIYLETPYSPDDTENTPTHIVIKSNIATDPEGDQPSEKGKDAEKKNPSDSGTPKTGDNSNVELWSILLGASAIAFLAVVIRRKKTQAK